MSVRSLVDRALLELKYLQAQIAENVATAKGGLAGEPRETEEEKRTRKRLRELRELRRKKTPSNC